MFTHCSHCFQMTPVQQLHHTRMQRLIFEQGLGQCQATTSSQRVNLCTSESHQHLNAPFFGVDYTNDGVSHLTV